MRLQGKEETYDLLNILDFNNDRKRMSVRNEILLDFFQHRANENGVLGHRAQGRQNRSLLQRC